MGWQKGTGSSVRFCADKQSCDFAQKKEEVMLANADLIHAYYKEQLELDVKEIVPFAQSMRKLKLDISVLDLVDEIIKKVQALGKGDDGGKRRSMEGCACRGTGPVRRCLKNRQCSRCRRDRPWP